VYVEKLRGVEGLEPALRKFQVGENEALFASVVEFVLEGLHLNRRLNRDKVEGRTRYKG
jgi:magnesium chelatase subunit I